MADNGCSHNIKDALNDGTVTCLKRVAGEQMLANCLTKCGASADQLIEVLQMGRYILPPTGTGVRMCQRRCGEEL